MKYLQTQCQTDFKAKTEAQQRFGAELLKKNILISGNIATKTNTMKSTFDTILEQTTTNTPAEKLLKKLLKNHKIKARYEHEIVKCYGCTTIFLNIKNPT
jgi:hypothetical protein